MSGNASKGDPKILIARAKSGDQAAFGQLYELYFVPIFRYISLRVKDRSEVEDLTQTVFLKVYSSIAYFEDRGKSPLAYFFTVARNTIIDHWKKKKETSFGTTEEIPGGEPAADGGPKEDAEKSERSVFVQNALTHLTADQREVVLLRFVHDLPTNEIAELLGRSEAAVRQLQVRALKGLRKRTDHKTYFA